MLFAIYPEFTSIESLPLATIEDKITFVSTLYEKGLVRTEDELEHSDEEDEEEDDESDSDEENGLVFKRQKVQDESTDDNDDDDDDDDDD